MLSISCFFYYLTASSVFSPPSKLRLLFHLIRRVVILPHRIIRILGVLRLLNDVAAHQDLLPGLLEHFGRKADPDSLDHLLLFS
mmetsp:Transcript_35173/g.53906  ORF Transcript_35173/g.53906 Transcript_35173/m.53906 type:complete len:84 (+) Transcript_35173:327-578(+)